MTDIAGELTSATKQLENDYAEASEIVSKAFSPVSDQFEESNFGLWNQEIKAWMDLSTLKGLFFNEDWVYILVDRIASKLAALELRVIRETGVSDGRVVYEPDEDHPVQARLWEPNENQTYYQWIYSIVADYCITGNALIWNAPILGQLIHIPIEIAQLDFDRDGKLDKYRIYQFNNEYDSPVPKLIATIAKGEIGHPRWPNPSSALWGLSPFIPGRKSILFNRYSQEYLVNFYNKGAQPGFIFEMDQEANEKNALRMLKSVELAHTGRRNQRRNMVVPKGVSVKNLSYSLSDQSLIDHVNQNRETIINILQVPKHELSIAEQGSLGSEEYKTALRNFWNGPLKSIRKAIEGSLTKLLKNELGEKRYIEFDLTDVDVLQEDLDKKAETATKLKTVWTLNEIRTKVFQMEPLPGGDELPSDGAPPAQGFAFSAPAPDHIAAVEPEGEIEDQQDVEGIDQRKAVYDRNFEIFSGLKAKNDWWKKREDLLISKTESVFNDFHNFILNMFAEQAGAVIEAAKKNLKNQGYKSLRTKDDPPSDDELEKARLRREIEKALEKFEDKYTEEGVPILETSIDTGYDVQLVLPFNLPNRAEVEALRSRNAKKRRDILLARGLKSFAKIKGTTTDRIMKLIEDGVAESKTVQEIAASIAREYSKIENINKRAMVIARTEVLTATSLGQAAAMDDAAKVIPGLQKMWITAEDDRVRGRYDNSEADHWVLRGETKSHKEPFSNGLQFPRDPNGEPAETIQCRCSWIMFGKDDADALGIAQFQSEMQAVGAVGKKE